MCKYFFIHSQQWIMYYIQISFDAKFNWKLNNRFIVVPQVLNDNFKDNNSSYSKSRIVNGSESFNRKMNIFDFFTGEVSVNDTELTYLFDHELILIIIIILKSHAFEHTYSYISLVSNFQYDGPQVKFVKVKNSISLIYCVIVVFRCLLFTFYE